MKNVYVYSAESMAPILYIYQVKNDKLYYLDH